MLNGLFFIYSKFIENVCFTHTVQLDRDRNQKYRIENFKRNISFWRFSELCQISSPELEYISSLVHDVGATTGGS